MATAPRGRNLAKGAQEFDVEDARKALSTPVNPKSVIGALERELKNIIIKFQKLSKEPIADHPAMKDTRGNLAGYKLDVTDQKIVALLMDVKFDDKKPHKRDWIMALNKKLDFDPVMYRVETDRQTKQAEEEDEERRIAALVIEKNVTGEFEDISKASEQNKGAVAVSDRYNQDVERVKKQPIVHGATPLAMPRNLPLNASRFDSLQSDHGGSPTKAPSDGKNKSCGLKTSKTPANNPGLFSKKIMIQEEETGDTSAATGADGGAGGGGDKGNEDNQGNDRRNQSENDGANESEGMAVADDSLMASINKLSDNIRGFFDYQHQHNQEMNKKLELLADSIDNIQRVVSGIVPLMSQMELQNGKEYVLMKREMLEQRESDTTHRLRQLENEMLTVMKRAIQTIGGSEAAGPTSLTRQPSHGSNTCEEEIIQRVEINAITDADVRAFTFLLRNSEISTMRAILKSACRSLGLAIDEIKPGNQLLDDSVIRTILAMHFRDPTAKKQYAGFVRDTSDARKRSKKGPNFQQPGPSTAPHN